MTQDDWKAEVDRIEAEGANLGFDGGPQGGITVIHRGKVNTTGCDALARWCLWRVGLEPFAITAPGWGCSYTTKKGSPGLHFIHWQLGVDYIGIYAIDPDTEERTPRTDGRPRPSRKGMWDRCYVIPDIPLPLDDDAHPDDWKEQTREFRRAWMKERRPRNHLMDALALLHLANWLQKNTDHPATEQV
jgi:hypothetical protein